MRGGGGGGGEEEEEERRGPVLRLPPPGLLGAAEGSEIENDSVRELTMEVERLGPGSGFSNVKMESLQVSAVELASERDSDGNGVDSVGSVAELEEQEVWKSRCASVGIENGSGEESVDIGEENGVRIGSDVSSVDGVFDSGRVGNGCESAAEFSSATVHLESGKEVDAYCSLNCESILTEEISEKLFVSESDGNKEENLNSSVDGERGNVVVQKQQEIKVNIGEPTQETIVLPLEIFKGDVCPSSQVGGEIGSSLEGLTSEAVSRSSTGLTSQQSPNNSTFIENCLEPLLVTDYEGCEVGAVTGFVSSFDRVNNSCGETENGGRSDMIDSRCANPNHAASLSSSLKDGKPEQLTRTRNNGRKFRKTVESTKPLLHATVKHLDNFKRKRSFPRRPARLSDWGPVDNLLKVFKQNGELESYASDTIPVKKVRPMFGVDREKHMKCQKDVTQVSSAVQDAPSHQPVFPVMDGSRSSDCLPTSVSQLDGGIFSAVRSEEKLAYDRCAYGLRSHQELGQIGDKDLDSTLMQEISVDDIVGKCHGVSPQVGPEMLVETVNCRSSLEAGTSPDSDVCHPMLGGVLMASEDASTNHVSRTIDVGIVPSKDTTSTNQVIGMDRSVTVLESVSGTGFPTGDIISSGASVTPFTVPPLESELHTSPRGTDSCKDSTQLCLISEHFMIDEKPHDLEKLNKSWKPSMQRKSEQKKNVSDGDSQLCSNFSRSTEKGSKCKSFPVESSAFGIAALEHSEESMKVQTLERWESSGMETSNWNSEERPMNNGLKGRKPPRSIKPRGSNDGSRRTNAHGKKQGNARKSDKKFSTKEKSGTFDASVDASDGMSLSSGTTKLAMAISNQFNSNTDAGSKVVSEEVSGSVTVAVGEQLPPKECNNSEEQSLSPKLAWVSCDDCQKWRCISVELANAIDDTNCKWICKDNTVKAFADCSIPQEKTNAEINAELGISDEDESFSANPSSKGPEPPKLAAPLQASWTVIKSNVFLHRNRRSQTIDEIMVCHCKPPRDGSLGCGDQCLNRMLNIECVKGTCPCGDLCSNQQFQKRKYVNLKKFHYGKKGYGLQLQEDASRGKFLIEYVGEVLDLASYEARQRYYASQGQKHFYFMTLNGGEVIDACVKGNLGRFINHSCDPNCRTEKWMVNGEVCIGLFAMRDIKKGEEVTFDYNYVRVVGAAAKKCVCGSSECRGYLGGDPLNSEVIVHGDSDDEALEPMINHEVGERDLNLEKTSLDGGDVEVVKKEQICIQRKDTLVQYSPAITEPNICDQIKNAVCCPSADIYPLDNPLPMLDSIPSEDTSPRSLSDIQPLRDPKDTLSSRQIEDTVCKPISDIQSSQLPLQTSNRVSTVLLDPSAISRKSVSSLIEGKSNTEKPLSHANYSRSRGKNKKGRSSVKHVVPPSSKKLTVGTGNGHCDGVEEKLNELLDMDGGISKQTDATRGYLKLLFVTAAEGDVRGCAFQSTRDLSLILDVILKTKSRKVLVDIINKNGLQMLHNILKQNRSNFNRIPIIRKLLKVLEFLALKGILSPEQINRDPPCNGMESFKESILSLTRHSDVQVHQIARNFRDKWIPRTFKRVEQSDRDGSRLDPQHSCRSWFQSSSKLKCWTEQGARETASIVTSTTTHLPASSVERDIPGQPSSHGQRVPNSAHVTDKISACGTRIRKRKSRWGPPLDTSSLHPQSLCSVENIVVDGVKCRKLSSVQQEKTSQHEGSNQTSSSSWDEIASVSNLMHKNANVESPPGFGSLRQNASVEAPPGFGYPQENGSGETPPQFGCLQHNDSGETPPGFGYPQKNASVEAPPGFGFPQQNPTVEAPPGFEIPQQNSSVEAPPGFEFPQQNASVETPPGFGFTQQNASDETPPGFVSPQQNASVEAPPGFGYLEKNANFEASPGFESRQEEHSSQMSSEIPVSPGEVFMGQLQGRYLSHLTVSFGIPVSLMQLGTPETGGSHCNPSWSVAPSMPFHPFPPLPSYPHPTAERGQTHVSSGTEKTTSSTSEGLGRISESFYRKSQIHGRLSWTSNGPARRFPGQQRRNDGRFPRCLPYPNQRIGQGTKGSMRDGTSNLGLEE